MGLFDTLEVFLLQPCCFLCQTPIHSHPFWLCSTCACQMVHLKNPCPLCAYPKEHRTICPNCHNIPSLLDKTHAALLYRPPLTDLIQAFKYHPKPNLARTLTTYLWHNPPHWLNEVDALLPMPLATTRLRYRGFNQATHLAKALQEHIKIPIIQDAIKRKHTTMPQAQIPKEERMASMQPDLFTTAKTFEDQKIVILDDVMTTGTTLQALAKTLRNQGAQKVFAWVLARAL